METGIVAEGGRVQGIYTAGVLDILLEHGIKTDGLIGVSAGAIHGCSFVAGQAGHSIRYNLKYYRDPRYMSFRSLIMTGDPVGDESCYHELPERLDPSDNDAFEASPVEFYATYADAEIDRLVYHRCGSLRGESIQWIRASVSIPLASRIVEIDGQRLLDGNVSDSILVAASRKMSSKRSLVMLTRLNGYRKEPNQMLSAIRRVYCKYPKSIRTMECRHLMHNRELEEVRRMESAGEISVICPSRLIRISQAENRPEKIQQMCDLGRLGGMKALQGTAVSLGLDPVTRA